MKKFTESEIYRARTYGDVNYLFQIMENQNEIIDKIKEIEQKLDFHFPEEEE